MGRAINQGRNRRAVNEIPSGTGTTFTLAHTPVSGSLDFKVNGLTLKPGTGSGQYALSANVVTTVTTYESDAEVLASYEW